MSDDKELFRRLNTKMRRGLEKIHEEITNAALPSAEKTNALFQEASVQLTEVIATTEQAAETIMDIVERHMDAQMKAADTLKAVRQGTASPEDVDCLAAWNASLGEDLTNLITTLSFQDLTGQRIKKVVDALGKIEETVVELYVFSGVVLQGSEADPQKGMDQLEAEAHNAVEQVKAVRSTLKGPTNDASQAQIDSLLKQLGME